MTSSSWPEVTLGEICTFRYGKSLPERARNPGEFSVYGSNGQTGTHVSALTLGPTIIVGRKGSFGEVHYSDKTCWPIDTTYYIDSTATACDLKWLAYRLSTMGLKRLNRAAAIPGLSREDAYRQTLHLPPLREQQRIAQVLDGADALCARRRKTIALLENLAQSIFLEMFGDPRENPWNWPTSTLSDLADPHDRINYGVVQPGDEREGGIPLLRVGNLTNGRVDRSRLKRIDPAIEAKYSRSRLKGNEVLVGCVGSIGSIALTSPFDIGSNIARAVARVPIQSEMTRIYVAEHLRSESVQHYFQSELRTVAQPTLNIKQLSETAVMMPPQNLQEEFASKVLAVEKQAGQHSVQLAEFDALFASLQHRAFRSERRDTFAA